MHISRSMSQQIMGLFPITQQPTQHVNPCLGRLGPCLSHPLPATQPTQPAHMQHTHNYPLASIHALGQHPPAYPLHTAFDCTLSWQPSLALHISHPSHTQATKHQCHPLTYKGQHHLLLPIMKLTLFIMTLLCHGLRASCGAMCLHLLPPSIA